MKQKLLLLALTFFLGMSFSTFAQKTMDVQKFTRMDNDLSARVTKPVKDKDEGKLCALIKIITNIPDLEVRPDALGIVQEEKHTGELWLYVPYGARNLTFASEGFFPVIYQYPESISEGTVYEIRLSSLDNTDGTVPANTNTQMFVLSFNPDEATLYIDDMEQPTHAGLFSAMMNKGTHKYRLEASGYEDVSEEFELGDVPIQEQVKMQPLFAKLQVNTQPENDFNVWNGKQLLGTTPFKSGRLEPGRYNIRIEKKDYYPVDTVVRLREGDDITLNCRLTSYADSLFYNRQLGGRRVSVGVQAGYIMPFVSSSAKGGFTGSMINYGLGDERENLKYGGQTGFTASIMLDIRLVKNFYLTTGLEYAYIKYDNKFNDILENAVIMTTNRNAYVGDQYNNYKENYTQQMIKLPILASYRFVLTKYASMHLNLGPWIEYGLSGKMKLDGSSDASGNIYNMSFGGTIDYDNPKGTFTSTDHRKGDFDMYSKSHSFITTTESGMNIGQDTESTFDFSESPWKKINCGLRLGATFELRGFQVGLRYDFQLTNSANKGFWESARVPLFNNLIGSNNMAGYSHRVHSLAVTVGYMFRY